MSGIEKRSIVIGKHKTSFSLEEPFLEVCGTKAVRVRATSF
jgi:predicted DNA-binding ribbon-helix-helix protein